MNEHIPMHVRAFVRILIVLIALVVGAPSYSVLAQEPAGASNTAKALCLSNDEAALGSVGGKVVSDATGDPIAGVIVRLVDLYGRTQLNTTTSITGTWALNSVWPLDYYVRYVTDSSLLTGHYIGEVYNDKTNALDPTIVQVAPGQNVAGIDASLATGAIIEGMVTSTAGGAPISGASIVIYSAATGEQLGFDNTDSGGVYRFSAGFAPGDYILFFNHFDYISEYFEDGEDFESATPITVVGTQAKVVNAALSPAPVVATGVVKGRITMADTGSPIPAARVSPDSVGAAAGFAQSVTADAQGYYTLTVPVGLWRIMASRSSSALAYAPRYLGGDGTLQGAETVVVAANAVLTGKDIALVKGWYIEGVVKGPGNVPVDRVNISAYDGDFIFAAGFNFGAQTDPDGVFKVGPLPHLPMTVDLFASNFDCTLVDETHVVQPPSNPAGTANLSPVLDEGALITGRVTTGTPARGERAVQVQVISGDETYYASTSDAGYYVSPALPAGPYKVGFFKDGFADLYFDGKPDAATAIAVSTTAGQVATSINGNLTPGNSGNNKAFIFVPVVMK